MSDVEGAEPHINDQSTGIEPPDDVEPAAADQAVRDLLSAHSPGPDGVTVIPNSAWNGFIKQNDLRPSTSGSDLEVEFQGRKFRQGTAPV